MATIKFKHNQEWRNLEMPVTVVVAAEKPVEYVEITGTTKTSSFPDLSPYISDISQIAFLSWNDTECASQTGYAKTYIYNPKAEAQVRKKTVLLQAKPASGASNPISIYSPYLASDDLLTLSGTPSAPILTNSYNNESAPTYTGTINLYYYAEE